MQLPPDTEALRSHGVWPGIKRHQQGLQTGGCPGCVCIRITSRDKIQTLYPQGFRWIGPEGGRRKVLIRPLPGSPDMARSTVYARGRHHVSHTAAPRRPAPGLARTARPQQVFAERMPVLTFTARNIFLLAYIHLHFESQLHVSQA